MDDLEPYSPLPPDESLAAETAPPRFKPRTGTYLVLGFLIIAYPLISLVLYFMQDEDLDISKFDPVLFIYLPTIIILWMIFLTILLALWREKATLTDIGLGRPRLSDLGKALIFLVLSNPLLLGLQWLLAATGVEFSKETDLIVAQGIHKIWWWMALCVTAAICEEVTFRGYLMTRLRHMIGKGWAAPLLLSAFAFATGHLYQGWGGFVLIFIYGLMFGSLYIFTGSLWPGMLAHFIQDFSAIFIYEFTKRPGS